MNFRKTTLAFLIYNILVIVWGAFVRISFSGDGCGDSWPLCDGTFVPTEATGARWIEWSHRASTGIFGLWGLFLFIWGYKKFSTRHPIRYLLSTMMLLIVSEALIGALLVKLRLVGTNASFARMWVMGIHQLTSLTLTGTIFLIYKQSSAGKLCVRSLKVMIGLFSGFAIVSFSGALAALAGTLFPSISLISGLFADLDTSSPVLLRLRLAHPLLAMLFCIFVFFWLLSQKSANYFIYIILMISFIFGIATLLSLSPVWMKLVHLMLAHVLCMSFIHFITERKKI